MNRELETFSVVVLGSFNPAIISPGWLLAESLLSREDAESAELGVTHPDIADFRVGGIKYHAQRNRLQLVTDDARRLPSMRDQAVALLSILRHTPVTQVGLNYDAHFRMPDEVTWHSLGDKLAPKQHWTMVQEPKLQTIVMRATREDSRKGYLAITIETSVLVQPYGIRFFVNDHIELADPEATVPATHVVDLLEDGWSRSFDRSQQLGGSLVGGAAT
jgi:hypothetical protein